MFGTLFGGFGIPYIRVGIQRIMQADMPAGEIWLWRWGVPIFAMILRGFRKQDLFLPEHFSRNKMGSSVLE